MLVWRLCKPRHAATPLDGEGARQSGGRWNHPGVPVVYAAESAALATLESLVRLQDVRLLGGYGFVRAEVPDAAVEDLDVSALDPVWKTFPHTAVTKDVGQEWLTSGRSLALRVPSVVVPGHNVLLNPRHARMREVRLLPFLQKAFDARLTG